MPAALLPPPEASPLAGTPMDPLRQADEPSSDAAQSPKPSPPGGPAGTAGVMTGYGLTCTRTVIN